MKYKLKPAFILLSAIILALASCKSTVTLAPGEKLQLASSTENDVEVVIALQRGENDQLGVVTK